MSQPSCSIGVDLGGTKLAAGVVTDAGELLASSREPTRSAGGYEAVVAQIAAMVGTLIEKADRRPEEIRSVGVGFAGQVDAGTGLVHHAPNLFPQREIPFGRLLTEKLGRKVLLDNDVRTCTLGEYVFGLASPVRSFFNVFVGTGVGSGFVQEGRLLRGHTNSACEVGHHTIRFDGPKCTCGNHGCLELYTGGLAIARLARQAMEDDRTTLLWELAREPARVDARAVGEAAVRGDETALALIDAAGRSLGYGLVNVVNLFNPEVLMLGGGIMKLGERFRVAAEAVLAERAIGSAYRRTRLVASRLADDAGLMGAACLWRVDPAGRIQEA